MLLGHEGRRHLSHLFYLSGEGWKDIPHKAPAFPPLDQGSCWPDNRSDFWSWCLPFTPLHTCTSPNPCSWHRKILLALKQFSSQKKIVSDCEASTSPSSACRKAATMIARNPCSTALSAVTREGLLMLYGSWSSWYIWCRSVPSSGFGVLPKPPPLDGGAWKNSAWEEINQNDFST